MFWTILQGLPTTAALTVGALFVGMLGGLPLVMARRSHRAALRLLARAYIELARGIPPIVWLFIVFYGIGASVPTLSPLLAAFLGLGIISSAFMAEIYRGGFAGVHAGQFEAAAALGMGRLDTGIRILAPQVIRVSIPATATYVIALLKDTSIAFTVGVTDILYYANSEARLLNQAVVPFLYAAGAYIALTIPLAVLSRVLEQRLTKRVVR